MSAAVIAESDDDRSIIVVFGDTAGSIAGHDDEQPGIKFTQA